VLDFHQGDIGKAIGVQDGNENKPLNTSGFGGLNQINFTLSINL
jgi:hypothetical protein